MVDEILMECRCAYLMYISIDIELDGIPLEFELEQSWTQSPSTNTESAIA